MGDCYYYDGSLTGFLTLCAVLIPKQIEPDQISFRPSDQPDLFRSAIVIASDPVVAEQFWQQITRKLSGHARSLVRHGLLADSPGMELTVYRYLVLASSQGHRSDGMLTHPAVSSLLKISRQVAREAHRYLGFVRFQQVQSGLYYAAIKPDHRILLLIGQHFAERLPDQAWVIHDLRHQEGIVYDQHTKEWLLLPMELHAQPEPTRQEQQFSHLWQQYFQTLAIPERKNLRLQQGKVPLKVRSCLTEFGGRGQTNAGYDI